jgi:hypothetical protein
MGGSSSKIEKIPFNCNKYSVKKTPLTFKNLEHKRCIFFPDNYYKQKKHLPSATLSITIDSTLKKLEYDIEIEIKKVYDRINTYAPAKILNPIYVAFARKLEYSGSIFDNNSLKKINVEVPGKNKQLAIKEYISSFLAEYPNYKDRYNSLPSNKYDFNNKITVIIYFPFITTDYKYITNFKDIISTSMFFVKVLLDASYSGLPDVNTFDENKQRKELEDTKQPQEVIDFLIKNLKENDDTNFRLKDDLMFLCNEGGCISEIGEDFNTLLPTLTKTDSDNTNVATNQSPFLPNKCLAQTIRYKCGVLAPDGNKSLNQIMTSEPIMKYLTESLSKYITNAECKSNPNANKRFCEEKSDKYANIQETPVDIINKAFSYELRNRFSSDYNKNEDNLNHYSIDYSINIIKELMFLRNTYPGIPEVIFPLYKYIGVNNYTVNPPWGPYFITPYNMIDYNEVILVNKYKFSVNNKFYLRMNESGYITVNYVDTEQIYYYLSVVNIPSSLSMSFKDKIEIIYIDNVSDNHTAKTVTTINMIKKDDKHREPFNFYLNDEGKLRVFANGFIDATDKTFADYIDNKINEYSLYSGSSTDGSSNSNDNYLKLYGSSNNLNTSLTKKEAAIYEEDPSKTSNINNQKSK